MLLALDKLAREASGIVSIEAYGATHSNAIRKAAVIFATVRASWFEARWVPIN